MIISSAASVSRTSSLSTSSTCAWMVTSSAVVGSSAISRRGLAGEGDRDQHALPHAAGELVRVLLDAAAPGSGMPTLREQVDRARLERLGALDLVVLRDDLGDLDADRSRPG